MPGRLRAEPVVGPRVIAVRSSVLDEVGGIPPGEHPLPALLARLRDAGNRIGLIPLPVGSAPTGRADPVSRSPVVILAAVPIHDIGGGSRSTQLAVEMVRQGYHVTLVSLYEAQESVDLGLRFVHPNLEQARVERFDPRCFSSGPHRPVWSWSRPPPRHWPTHAKALQTAGWEMVYDVIDDWSDPALGGEWYRPETEKDLIISADRVVASAPDLVQPGSRLRERSDPGAERGQRLDCSEANFPPARRTSPRQRSSSAITVRSTATGSTGNRCGGWPRPTPRRQIVLIGDDKTTRPVMPSNVHLLGLKAQGELPAYVQRFDVGVIPFRMNETTHAVSPLKAYEYLASGVPIAAPPLRALEGMDGVHTDTDLAVAVAAALVSDRPDRARALKEHSWEDRVVRITGSEAVVVEYSPVSVVTRPAIHYAKAERLVSESIDGRS